MTSRIETHSPVTVGDSPGSEPGGRPMFPAGKTGFVSSFPGPVSRGVPGMDWSFK